MKKKKKGKYEYTFALHRELTQNITVTVRANNVYDAKDAAFCNALNKGLWPTPSIKYDSWNLVESDEPEDDDD